ncbi:DUF3141 domain-containing protein [Paracoccus sp. (in: a-proteobacteria)]|uniref:DUF3141 domain-containing protein n=1 Tax=Paracoccus sp. TaxID=267 RepID=UPI0032208C6D
MAQQQTPRLPDTRQTLEYMTDAWQRSVLYLDVMRQRAEQFEAHLAQPEPNVLSYRAEVVMDGRDLPRPVNYRLLAITPPARLSIDPAKRPFVVIDPRAGHGPGIGGFKADSEIGVALRAGHPVYFIGFLPEPEPGQTILDIAAAEATFLETVIARHPAAEGKPCVIGNCQAGWAVMLLAALRPELFGPLILAGAPLSYWAGKRGQGAMRYAGGLLGGSWLTALAGDLGAGRFDGAWLVQNFENMNPANTLWRKQYDLWSEVDTESGRYLGFERWWDAHVSLNAGEMQWIVDELFIGNHLAAGEIRADDGTAIDLRAVRAPIVVFCSQGDAITPPQQALDWILDLYDSEEDIRAWGQTIVYTVHDHVGHLGLFVSGGVARKEHGEFASNIDLIDVLPPGLYEAVLTPRAEAGGEGDLVGGDWLMRCEARTLDDIRALGGNDLAEDRAFEAAARLSEINLALYRRHVQPAVQALASPQLAEAMRRMHPLRRSLRFFGSANPWMPWVAFEAGRVRENRLPAAPDNPFLALQARVSESMVAGLEAWRRTAENIAETGFHAIYGNGLLQAALGIDTTGARAPRKPARSQLHDKLVCHRREALRADMDRGGLDQAVVRALVWAAMSRRVVDERSFAAITRLRKAHAACRKLTLGDFKALVRQQYLMLVLDEEAALQAIPALLPEDAEARRNALATVCEVIAASGPPDAAGNRRLERIAELFGLPPGRDRKLRLV